MLFLCSVLSDDFHEKDWHEYNKKQIEQHVNVHFHLYLLLIDKVNISCICSTVYMESMNNAVVPSAEQIAKLPALTSVCPPGGVRALWEKPSAAMTTSQKLMQTHQLVFHIFTVFHYRPVWLCFLKLFIQKCFCLFVCFLFFAFWWWWQWLCWSTVDQCDLIYAQWDKKLC